jgi:hypothetical protein
MQGDPSLSFAFLDVSPNAVPHIRATESTSCGTGKTGKRVTAAARTIEEEAPHPDHVLADRTCRPAAGTPDVDNVTL